MIVTDQDQYAYFLELHRDYSMLFKKQVGELELLVSESENLLRATEPVMNQYLTNMKPGPPKPVTVSWRDVVKFLGDHDAFCAVLKSISDSQRYHTEAAGKFVDQIEKLNKKNTSPVSSEAKREYVEMLPVLERLTIELRSLNDNVARETRALNDLNLRWQSIEFGLSIH